MLFSIITITKNNLDGFNKTRQSIESQSYSDYEWIVIDGAVEPDNGIYDAMNKGLNRAQGDYVVFMNAGDEFADRDALSHVVNHCGQADLIYGDAFEGKYLKRAKSYQTIAQGLFTHHQAIYYKRAMIGDLRYDQTYPIAADYQFTIQFINRAQHIVYVDKPLCIFEGGGVSATQSLKGREEQIQIRKELGIKAPFTPYRQVCASFVKSISKPLYYNIKYLTNRFAG